MDQKDLMCSKCEEAKQLIQSWIDKQGHDRCWYYPEIFEKLIAIYDIKSTISTNLPSRSEFREGCLLFEEQQYSTD